MDIRISLRISRRMHSGLKKIAYFEKISISEVVCDAITGPLGQYQGDYSDDPSKWEDLAEFDVIDNETFAARITLRLPAETYSIAVKAAEHKRLSVADLIRELIDGWFYICHDVNDYNYKMRKYFRPNVVSRE